MAQNCPLFQDKVYNLLYNFKRQEFLDGQVQLPECPQFRLYCCTPSVTLQYHFSGIMPSMAAQTSQHYNHHRLPSNTIPSRTDVSNNMRSKNNHGQVILSSVSVRQREQGSKTGSFDYTDCHNSTIQGGLLLVSSDEFGGIILGGREQPSPPMLSKPPNSISI